MIDSLIDVYTRSEIIQDGFLVDVTNKAQEIGFKCSVAISKSIDVILKDIPEKFKWQEYDGRLWDLLYVAYAAAVKNKRSREISFWVNIPHVEKGLCDQENILVVDTLLKLVAGPDDNFKLCLTIMLPDED